MTDEPLQGRAAPALTHAVAICWMLLLAVGVVLVVISPPFSGPDEAVHFMRMWAVSRGDIVPERRGAAGSGSDLPCELPTLANGVTTDERGASFANFRDPRLRAMSHRLRPSGHAPDCFVSYSATAVYTPVAYLVPATAMRLARLADAGALSQLQAARAANLLVSWLILGAALRVAPSISWTILAFSALPMAAFLRSTHVSDSLLGAASLLLVAFVVRAIRDHSYVVSKGVATAAFIALLKPLYLFLPFVALVPGGGGEARRRRVLALLVLGAATIVSLELSRAGYVPARQDRPDATGTATELLASPFRFAKLVTLDLVRNAANYEMGFTGVLGWLDAPVPRTTRRLIFAMLAFIVFVESQQLESSRLARIAALVLIIASVLLVQLSLFVSWTPPGTERIIGVQGRYFLPIAALVPLTLPRVAAISPRLAFVAGICFVPFSLVVTIVVVAIRYWL